MDNIMLAQQSSISQNMRAAHCYFNLLNSLVVTSTFSSRNVSQIENDSL